MISHIQMRHILQQCTGKIQHEDLIEFTRVGGRNQGYKISAFPRFLSTKDDSTSTMLGLQNRQECMFWMRSPDLMISLLKASEILVYTLLILGSPILFYFWDENLLYFGLLLLTQALAVALMMAYLPQTIADFSVCTNIVMMRDMVSAQEAVEEQKKVLYDSYQACYRIFITPRALKMLNRQLGTATDADFVKNSINPLHKSQITKLFEKISHGDLPPSVTMPKDRITLTGLRDLGHLLGQRFTEDEWAILAHECLEEDDGGSEMVIIDKMISTVEKMVSETKTDPYNLIKSLVFGINPAFLS